MTDKIIMNQRLICGSAFDIMPTLARGSVDLILTDPPYGISKKTGFQNVKKGEKRFAVNMDFGKWDHTEVNLCGIADYSKSLLRKGGTIIIFYDLWKIEQLKNALEFYGFKMVRLIIWQKTNPVPLNMKRTYLSNSREVAVVAVKGGKPTFNGEYDNGVYDYPIPRHKRKKIHPTQKPIDLFNDLVLKHSNEGDVVLDPFMGSGTTLDACRQNGRNGIGIEIDPNYYELTCKRIKGE